MCSVHLFDLSKHFILVRMVIDPELISDARLEYTLDGMSDSSKPTRMFLGGGTKQENLKETSRDTREEHTVRLFIQIVTRAQAQTGGPWFCEAAMLLAALAYVSGKSLLSLSLESKWTLLLRNDSG